jgi:hypothetical protein
MSYLAPWLVLFGLGAYHGVNPGMGWLFAVALGLQERKRGALLRALPPIAIGHALSIGVVVGAVLLLNAAFPYLYAKIAAAALLIGFAIYRLFRRCHPGWVGMRVGFRDLVMWSFLMASAHGAGLMLLPILVERSPQTERSAQNCDACAAQSARIADAGFRSPASGAAAVVVHTLGHLLAAGVIALLVYEYLGLAFLQKAWLNLDILWIAALLLAGILVIWI